MTFEEALQTVKQGNHAMYRGKMYHIWVEKVVVDRNSLPGKTGILIDNDKVQIPLGLCTWATNGVLVSVTPNQYDLLSKDWKVIRLEDINH